MTGPEGICTTEVTTRVCRRRATVRTAALSIAASRSSGAMRSPSALETIFVETHSTSPSRGESGASASASSAARSAPSRTSPSPVSGRTDTGRGAAPGTGEAERTEGDGVRDTGTSRGGAPAQGSGPRTWDDVQGRGAVMCKATRRRRLTHHNYTGVL